VTLRLKLPVHMTTNLRIVKPLSCALPLSQASFSLAFQRDDSSQSQLPLARRIL
jgi:hypothetical protein